MHSICHMMDVDLGQVTDNESVNVYSLSRDERRPITFSLGQYTGSKMCREGTYDVSCMICGINTKLIFVHGPFPYCSQCQKLIVTKITFPCESIPGKHFQIITGT